MIKCQKDLFSLNTGTTYLNCAYMSPILKKVEEAGISGIREKRDPSIIGAVDFFTTTEELRSSYSRLINTHEPNRIVIIPSVSYGISTVAKNISLKEGEKIIVLEEQFPSNYYPWKRLCEEQKGQMVTVKRPSSSQRGSDWNDRILNEIDAKTKVVALPHVHWADGTLFSLKEIRKKTLEVGALLIIDGTQSVGAFPFDVQEIKPDALICAGYKWLLGPYSIGLAYYGPAFDEGVPIEENWINRYESEDFSGLVNYNNQYQPGALRFEVGEHSNFILTPMLLESVRQLESWGVSNIQDYCQKLFEDGIEQLTNDGFKIESSDFRSSHLFGIRSAKKERLEAIKIALQKEKVSVSVRGDAVRVSPHVYNDENDVNKLLDILLSIR